MSVTIAKSKSWLYYVNVPMEYTTTGVDLTARTLLTMKNILLGGNEPYGFSSWTDDTGAPTTGPTFWTVDYSCNAIVAGTPGDGVDRWTTYTDCDNYSASGAHAWIVLKNSSAITGKTLYWLISRKANDDRGLAMYTATTAFTGGSTTVDPTSTTQSQFASATDLWHNYDHQLHFMMSADGTSTRIFHTLNGTLNAFWLLEPLVSPSGAVRDGFMTMYAGISSYFEVNNMCNRTWYVATRLSDNTPILGGLLSQGTRYPSSVMLPESSGPYPVFFTHIENREQAMPISVWAQDVFTYPINWGQIGNIQDLWWWSDDIGNGTTVPGDRSAQFAVFAPFLIPWNGNKSVRMQ
jgi:hypothetical protein